ncbi:MAG TPA: nucleoid-associated protein, partial [Bacteroidales bacterium]|nr:nucleoid-associated protein [Bacteroidales bacterium]
INEFENSVLQDKVIIESFRAFDESFREEKNINVPDIFGINPSAVKKQVKVFKSVLKLDRNFHIYIHGNRELIERGVDENGRKYYKIFYDNEE